MINVENDYAEINSGEISNHFKFTKKMNSYFSSGFLVNKGWAQSKSKLRVSFAPVDGPTMNIIKQELFLLFNLETI